VRIGTWADSSLKAARSTEQAISLLRAIPGGPKIAVTHRVEDGNAKIRALFTEEQLAALIKKAPIRAVAIASLLGSQRTVNRGRVESYLKKPNLMPPGARGEHGGLIDLPIIMQLEGKRFTWDGNHRAVAATLSGARLLRVRYVDLDEELRRGHSRSGSKG
jgi:hypothetical protein